MKGSALKHSEGNVMSQACMAASGTDSLILIDDINHYGSNRMKFTGTFCLPILEECIQIILVEHHFGRPHSTKSTMLWVDVCK